MSTLTENAQKYIEQVMQDLSGDEDFLPFMTIKDRKDRIILAGLVMPEDPDQKDQMADMMTALCMVHRGVEVVFASSSWMVTHDSDSPYKMGQPAPSKHPDRVEVAFVVMVNTEGQCVLHSAPLIRENNMVAVGMWSTVETTEQPSGRFAKAIHIGMGLGQKLPPEMSEYIDDEANESRVEEIVRKTARMIGEARKGGVQELKVILCDMCPEGTVSKAEYRIKFEHLVPVLPVDRRDVPVDVCGRHYNMFFTALKEVNQQ